MRRLKGVAGKTGNVRIR